MQDHQTTQPSFREILVPLDGSEFAAAALPTARAAATRLGAKLSTISVAGHRSEVETLRDRVWTALGENGHTEETTVVVDADPAAAIVRRAEERDALVVMSTRGRGRITGAFVGSVARSVVAASAAPVLVVGPNADRPGMLTGRPRRRPESWPEPLSIGAVVAAVDGTQGSEAVLPLAATWAEALDRDLVVLTIAEDAPPRPSGATPNRFGPADPRSYVDTLAATLREEHPELPRVVGHVTFDPIGVASGLTRYLSDHATTLVALAAPVRTGLDRLRLGATAADMIRNATVPTLVTSTCRALALRRDASSHELHGGNVIPVLRSELDPRRPEHVPDEPAHTARRGALDLHRTTAGVAPRTPA